MRNRLSPGVVVKPRAEWNDDYFYGISGKTRNVMEWDEIKNIYLKLRFLILKFSFKKISGFLVLIPG